MLSDTIDHDATRSGAVTGTLDVPGASLYYEVRGTGPLVVLAGAPMDADPFAALADLLATDHTVLTTDPRGVNRSTLADPDQDSSPRDRADDVARLITHLDAGPAIVLGSSGGAVTALALAEARPELVHTVVAHEPPLCELLDDRAQLAAATDDMIATYLAGDVLGAWAKFFATANITVPDGMLEMAFGGDRAAQAVADERFWFAHELRLSTSWQPDLAALRATRVVVGVGEDSGGELCERTSLALAEALGVEPTMFPGGHTGFTEEPAPFAARLRAALSV